MAAMDVGLLIKLVGGLFLLVAGGRQAVRTPLVRRGGVRSTGSVVRVQREWDARENVWMYAPVVAFRDEQGAGREFTTTTMTTWAAHEPGQEVTVLHPPGRPELARL